MKINKIKISNILGIDNLEFEPGKFTQIEGKNGSGKTSIIEALKSVFKGGNDATLLRNGKDKGEIVFEFDDETVVIRTVKENGSSVEMYDRLGKKLNKPQNILNTLTDIFSVNPISFLTTDKKSRTKILLELIPSDIVPIDKLNELIKEYNLNINYNENESALEIIDKYYNLVYAERTAINRISKEKLATKNQMNESMVEVVGDEDEIKVKLIELEKQQYKFNDKKLEYQEDILSWFEGEIKKLNEEKSNKMQELELKFKDKIEPVKTEIITLNEQLKLTASFSKTKEMLLQYTNEINTLNSQSSNLSEILEQIQDIKTSVLNNLPFENINIIDGEIYKNEIPFDRLNEAEKVKIAVQIAKYKAGELGIICVDGIERLDTETFNKFKEVSENSNLQLIVTKVTDNELTIHN